jgi:hypothetical protein
VKAHLGKRKPVQARTQLAPGDAAFHSLRLSGRASDHFMLSCLQALGPCSISSFSEVCATFISDNIFAKFAFMELKSPIEPKGLQKSPCNFS